MSVSADEVRHIAALARLGVADDKVATLAAELSSILEHMVVLRGADTADLPDDDLENRGKLPLRPDSGAPLPLTRSRDDFAPASRDGFFLVPRLATHEDEAGE
jgi:aspartyl-tRNA(Asn)/glutamyl-tRNA(Gln) amidotransferase subunit C